MNCYYMHFLLQSTDLANLFSPPTGKELFKCKSRTKLKQKLNPTLEVSVLLNVAIEKISKHC